MTTQERLDYELAWKYRTYYMYFYEWINLVETKFYSYSVPVTSEIESYELWTYM